MSFHGKRLRNTKLLNTNKLKPNDTHTFVCDSGGYSMLMF